MFSKALFRQSSKANGTMWTIITFAVCFMLACVMLISGSGSIGETKNAIEDTIIQKEIEAGFKSRSVGYYSYSEEGMRYFDKDYTDNVKGSLVYLGWLQKKPAKTDGTDDATYNAYLAAWKAAEPDMTAYKENNVRFKEAIEQWTAAMPTRTAEMSDEQYAALLAAWNAQSPANVKTAVALAYQAAFAEMNDHIAGLVKESADEATKTDKEKLDTAIAEATSAVNCVMYPEADESTEAGAALKAYYEKAAAKGETIPEHYDVTTLTQKLAIALTADPESDIDGYINGDERTEYRNDRAETLSSVFLAVNMTDEANVRLLLDALSSYGVTEEKFESFGYGDYARAKDIARTSIITYRGRLDYEISEITAEKGTPEYEAAVASVKAELTKDVTSSLLSSLPKEVSEALEDIGQADLYTLIVGSIFYKLAGLLLPIIFMIMAANNLISGQVDSGSMAYVLSTSTKRKTVAITQAIYLIGSLLVMFVLTTITGCICLAIVKEDVQLTYGKLVLLNAGAFLVLFALSGLNFFTSCWFDRSKRSMAIGGGLSIFALVAAMLGLFGSPVIPKVVRLDSLNYFNYTTIISLFDVVSIMDGNLTFLWKFAILFVVGIIGYVAGSVKFVKKDLPL